MSSFGSRGGRGEGKLTASPFAGRSGRDAPCRPGSAPGARSRPGPRGRRTPSASAAAASTSAPGSRPGTRRPNRPSRACRRLPYRPAGCRRRSGSRAGNGSGRKSRPRRMQESMPSASTSTFIRPTASMSSLSHSMKVRSAMAALPIGTVSSIGTWLRTKPPTCCERWRGKPISSFADRPPGGSPDSQDRDRPAGPACPAIRRPSGPIPYRRAPP